ncbi:type II CAAX endopeptidase family protein [uncultured Rikenella sp.]|uniref:CPBP family intramembrane glutamic endopeptidase n=1 Tax=uncultured Rikenella sp. TaxID=368003 RepID=UPI0025F6DDC1|nr:type II CAAX endopeptidase family protein [uncultured Rikenella sp.]
MTENQTDTNNRRSLWFPLFSLLILFCAANMLLGTAAQHLDGFGNAGFRQFLAYVGSFALTIGYALAIRRPWGLLMPSFRPEKWKLHGPFILVGVILLFATGILLAPITDRMPDTYTRMLDDYLRGGLWPILTAAVAAPLLEELLFRGIIQKNLVARIGPGAGILIGAAVFGAIHFIPQQMIYAGCVGLILGCIYHFTGSLGSTVAIHFINNGIAILAGLVPGADGTGIERRILGGGEGPVWYTAYALSLALAAAAVLYAVRRIRRERADSARRD